MYEFLEQSVGAVLTTPCRHVSQEMTVRDLHHLFAVDDVEAFPVVNAGVVVGIVSKFDALRPFAFGVDRIVPAYDEVMGTVVEEIMSRDVISTTVDAPLTHVLQSMIQHRIKSLPVLDGERRLIGIIAREDIFEALRKCTHCDAPAFHLSERSACRPTG